MMKRTISGMTGTGSLAHNRRDFFTENVNPNRVYLNICYRDENLKDVYKELFQRDSCIHSFSLPSGYIRYKIEWEQKGTHEEHLDVYNFKKKERAKEVKELEQKIENLTADVEATESICRCGVASS